MHTLNHPLIHFRTGASGRRYAACVGTRLAVYQVVATALAEKSASGAAEYLGIPVAVVNGAMNYYADFSDEIDADTQWAAD